MEYEEGPSVLQEAAQGVMSGRAASPVRNPRADAIRNRERLLETAVDIFSAGGPDASLEAVAKAVSDQMRAASGWS